MRRLSVVGMIVAAAVLLLWVVPALAGSSASPPPAPPTPPFAECPAVWQDTSCQFLITITDHSQSITRDPTQGPYEGSEDALIGMLNSSTHPIASLAMGVPGDGIFALDSDGLCTPGGTPIPPSCPFGPTGYEGPGTTLTATDSDTGTVTFSPPIAPGASAYFSLELPPNVQPTVGAPTTLTTTLSGAGMTGAALTVARGKRVSDAATLTGANAATATGTVSYDVFSDSACATQVASAGTVTVSNGAVPPSNGVKLGAGTYYWQASYSGDQSNQPVKSPCGPEILTIPLLIAGLGDSLASGEGVPNATRGSTTGVQWDSARCDRSHNSFEALAVHGIEAAHPGLSLTFIHLACSGAGIRTGVLGPYFGIAPNGAKQPLETQVGELRTMAGKRKIDAVLISVGVNDLDFGNVIEFCIRHTNCQNENYVAAHGRQHALKLNQWVKRQLAALPSRYKELARKLKPLSPRFVYITEYPDPLRDANGMPCASILAPPFGFGGDGITTTETTWMENSFLNPLNTAIQKAAKANSWTFVGGAYSAFRAHGYCATAPPVGPTGSTGATGATGATGPQSWIVTLGDSLGNQGDRNGTLHPSIVGQQTIANLFQAKLESDLFKPPPAP